MHGLELLGTGMANLISHPQALLLAAFGTAFGIIIGALPGLTATMGVAIMLPFTFGMDPVAALLMLAGIQFGGVYAGSITAILLKIPGTPAAAATAIDGYMLTQQGKAGLALGTATFSSFFGGTVSVLALIFLSPLLAGWALKFSAAETFALACFGLSIIASVSGQSLVKGLIAGVVGLLVSSVGLDPIGGFPRFTAGMDELLDVKFIPIMIGLFATAEAFKSMEKSGDFGRVRTTIGRIIPPWSEIKRLSISILRSTGLGIVIGIIPGAGSDVAAFVAYNEAKRFSKTPENFGKGELSAVASCEAGANGCTGGALLPMLTLGIPGDAVTAVMLGALVLQGLQPGPMLFAEHSDMVYTLFAGMLVAYLMMLIMGLGSLRIIGRVLQIPASMLNAGILVLSVVGTYALGNSMFDVGIMFVAGVIGYFMQKWGYPASPVVLALIMGPIAESNFRRALSISNGSFDFLYTRPITVVLLLLAIVTLAAPIVGGILKHQKRRRLAHS
jgi:putative tricarboxylic transport membrane protein